MNCEAPSLGCGRKRSFSIGIIVRVCSYNVVGNNRYSFAPNTAVTAAFINRAAQFKFVLRLAHVEIRCSNKIQIIPFEFGLRCSRCEIFAQKKIICWKNGRSCSPRWTITC